MERERGFNGEKKGEESLKRMTCSRKKKKKIEGSRQHRRFTGIAILLELSFLQSRKEGRKENLLFPLRKGKKGESIPRETLPLKEKKKKRYDRRKKNNILV